MKTNGVFRRLLGGGLGALAISVACCWGQAAGAEDWPQFRGPTGGYAAPTPTTDGKLLYCAFGSSAAAALDFKGKIIWREDSVPHTFDVTLGSSPILYRDTLILLCAMAVRKDSRIVAFNKADGSINWEQSIAPTAFAHSTPAVAGGKIFLVGMKSVYCIGQLSASSPAPETPTPSTPLTVDKGARAGVKITDATDKQIVQRFLEHVDRLPRWITREYCRKMAADEPEGYTWKVLPQVEMYLTAFEVTGDAKYLDGFAAVFAGMRAAMTKGPDGYLGWYGKPLGLFRNPAKADLKADVIISSFRTVDVLCHFLELAARDDSLAKRFADRRRGYVDLMVNHLVKKWTARGNYVDLGDRGAIYRTHAGLRDTKGHLTQPHNKHSKIIRGLLGLYRVTGRSEYMQMAVKLGVRFKRCLTLRNGHYEWNYWDPAGPWDVHPTKPGQWKHWIGPEHRGGYYSLSLTQAVGLWGHGLVFDDADMQRFVKTQLEATWNGRLDDPKWFRVDRSRGTQDGRYICPALAPFDKKIHTFLYTGPRQAERLANAKHSWQGGPVANGWIRGKYINHPAAAGGKQIHLAAGKKFLTEPANRKFMQSQRFDVTGGGYRAQPNPK